MLPTLRQLQYLILLHKHGSFSRAADAAHVTQPTLSAGIQELEKILGAPMVDRGRSGLIFTPCGQDVVARGQAILNQAEDLVAACRSAGKPLEGRLRLGVIPTVAPFLLPAALPALKKGHPRLKLFLREDLTHRLIEDLKAGALDAVLIALPYDTAGLSVAHVADDDLLAALPSGHPLAAGQSVTQADFGEEDLILLEDGHCLREHALGACGLELRRPLRDEGFAATSLATLVQMVGSGLGVTLLPQMAVAAGLARSAQVEVRRLDPTRLSREIVVAWREGSTRAGEGALLAEIFAKAMAEATARAATAAAPAASQAA